LLLCALAVTLGGCASVSPQAREAALRERAVAYWEARRINDLVTAYQYEAASTRPGATLQAYLASKAGAVRIERAEVGRATITSDDQGEVSVKLVYRLPIVGGGKPIEADSTTTWQLIDGQWYHAPRPSVMWSR